MAGIGTTNDFDISAADGVTTVFTYTFFAYTDDQVKVYSVINDVLTPITTGITITPNSDYIGGSVTFTTAPGSEVGEILRRREVPYTQTTEFSDITRYKEPAIEKALNTLEMQIQQVKSLADRSLKYTEAADATDATIETPVDGALLGFDGITGRIKAVLLASLSLTGLDTIFTGLAAGDFFIYDGVRWINRKFLGIKGTSIASAGTTNIGNATTDFIDVTGTTTITSLGTGTNRNHVWVNFTGALTLTHNATSLILPGGASITTAAGDQAEFIRISGGNWKCVNYVRANGTPLVASTIPDASITFAKLASSAVASLSDWASGTVGVLLTASNFLPALLAALGYSKYVQLSDQTITSAGALTIAHGLGSAPKDIVTQLVNVTAELAYTVGQVTPVNPSLSAAAASNSGHSITWDATNIYIRFGSNAGSSYDVIHATTGARSGITNANWKLRLQVRA